MPKYLFQGSYTAAGAAGVLKEGGMGRAAALKALMKSLGGSIESQYWAFGGEDFFIVADLPDDEAAAVGCLAVNASACGARDYDATAICRGARRRRRSGGSGRRLPTPRGIASAASLSDYAPDPLTVIRLRPAPGVAACRC